MAQVVIILQTAVLPFGAVFLGQYWPTVLGPINTLNDGAAAQGVESVAIGVLYYIPVAVGIVNKGTVTF